jgi:hypothetical protein
MQSGKANSKFKWLTSKRLIHNSVIREQLLHNMIASRREGATTPVAFEDADAGRMFRWVRVGMKAGKGNFSEL